MAWQTPKTNWDTVPKNPKSEDLNRIEGNIDFLKTDIEIKKGLIVDALNLMGRTAFITDTHAELAVKIKDISDDANAVVADVLPGKTFYQGGTKKTGTMPTKAAQTYTPGTTNQTIAANRYLTGIQTILGDVNLVPVNIAPGKNIFGVTGAYIPSMIVEILTASQTWTVPSGVNKVFVLVVGGGSGGASGSNNSNRAGGGGGGGYGAFSIMSVTPGSGISVVIGAGGARSNVPPASSATPQKAGGQSSFGALTAAGGGVGTRAGYSDWFNTYNGAPGGAGGGAGGGSRTSSSYSGPGGAGGSGVTGGAGANGTNTDPMSGGAGSGFGSGFLSQNIFGMTAICGGGGGGGAEVAGGAGGAGGGGAGGANATNGSDATAYGGGGGGGGGNGAYTGGAGYQGVVALLYFR